jgi:hypothetical protein
MKTAFLALLSVVALLGLAMPSVVAMPLDTNADRLARGLPPNPPTRRTGLEPRSPRPSGRP